MANPLFNGGTAGGFNPTNGIDPHAIQRIMALINSGADIKDIIVSFKKSGMSPQVIEQVLCMAFPQLKQLKEQMEGMKNAGMSQQDIFASFAKKANVDPSQISKTYESLMKLVR